MTVIDYETYIRSEEWRLKADAIKARIDYCALCPARTDLEVHHRTYARLGQEHVTDLVVLCHRCHARHHGTFDECLERQLLLPFRAFLPAGSSN